MTIKTAGIADIGPGAAYIQFAVSVCAVATLILGAKCQRLPNASNSIGSKYPSCASKSIMSGTVREPTTAIMRTAKMASNMGSSPEEEGDMHRQQNKHCNPTE